MGYNFKQYDARWGKKNYNGSSTYAKAACGPTSCASIVYDKDTSITPVDCGNYMKAHKYAIPNNGTSPNGITPCLKHFGFKNVKKHAKTSGGKSYGTISSMAKAMAKNNTYGIILFRAGTKGGVTWTTGGHYIAVDGYKKKDGKHYFHTLDSAGRNHTGWYCWETQMKGLDRMMWSAELDIPSFPRCATAKNSNGVNVVALQRCLNKVMKVEPKLVEDGEYLTKTEERVKVYQKSRGLVVDGIAGKKTLAQLKKDMG